MKSILLFLFYTSCLLVNSFAQTTEPTEYIQSHYTAETGLPQNSIRAMVFTPEGFLWMATEDGLVRFDGNNFKIFNKKNTGITNNRFLYIEYDPTRCAYVAVSYNYDKLLLTSSEPLLLPQTDTFGILLNKREKSVSLPFVGIASRKKSLADFFSIQVSENEQFWIVRKHIAFLRNSRIIWQLPQLGNDFSYDVARYFCIDKQLFYIDKDGAFFRFSSMGIKPAVVSGDLTANRLYGKKGHPPAVLWMNGSRTVIVYLNHSWYTLELTKNNTFHTKLILTKFDGSEHSIGCAAYDPVKKILILGSLTDGLFIFKQNQFTTLRVKGSAYENSFYGIIPYGKSGVLSAKGYLFDRKGLVSSPNALLNISESYSIASDKGGLFTRFTNAVNYFTDISKPPVQKWIFPFPVTQLFSDTISGDVWVGTQKGVFIIHNRKKQIDTLTSNLSPVSYLQKENDAIIWVGTEKGCFRINKLTKKTDTIRGLSDSYIRSITTFHPGEIWICTYEDGFYLYKNNNLTKFPLDKNRYLATAHNIMEDGNGYLWISTNRGLFQASRAELLQYASGKQGTPYYAYYSTKEGLLTNEFNGGGQASAISLPDGRLAFSGLKGIVVFNPQIIGAPIEKRSIIIGGIEIDNRMIALTDSLKLPVEFNQLKINVTIPYFGNPYNLNMEYCLKKNSTEENWLPIVDNTITFTHIPTGTYQLLIRDKERFLYNKYIYKTIYLTISPAWYETVAFKIAGVILLMLVVYLFNAFRTRRLEKKNKLLDKIIAERTQELNTSLKTLQRSEASLHKGIRLQKRLIASISHDIKSPLRFLSMATRESYEKRNANEPVTIEETKVIYQTAEQLFRYTEKMLQFISVKINTGTSEKREFPLRVLVDQKIAFFSEIALAKNNKLFTDIDPEIILIEKEELLGVIIHNLIDNAIKFTKNGTICISGILKNKQLIITISDTGNGMSEEAAQNYRNYFSDLTKKIDTPDDSDKKIFMGGLGFEIIKEILPILSARIEIRTRKGEGTKIDLILNGILDT